MFELKTHSSAGPEGVSRFYLSMGDTGFFSPIIQKDTSLSENGK